MCEGGEDYSSTGDARAAGRPRSGIIRRSRCPPRQSCAADETGSRCAACTIRAKAGAAPATVSRCGGLRRCHCARRAWEGGPPGAWSLAFRVPTSPETGLPRDACAWRSFRTVAHRGRRCPAGCRLVAAAFARPFSPLCFRPTAVRGRTACGEMRCFVRRSLAESLRCSFVALVCCAGAAQAQRRPRRADARYAGSHRGALAAASFRARRRRHGNRRRAKSRAAAPKASPSFCSVSPASRSS